MSKQQNLSPPPSPPVKDFNSRNATISLPPLPDDFLSFQPQSSFAHDPINDVDNGAAYTTDSLDNVQQRGSYRGGRSYYNKERYNNHDRYSQKKGNYSRNCSGGGGDKYHYDDNYRSYGSYGSPSYRPPKGDQQLGGQRGRWNNNTSSKKRKVYYQTVNKSKKDVDISLYYKKSFVEDPWADLMKK